MPPKNVATASELQELKEKHARFLESHHVVLARPGALDSSQRRGVEMGDVSEPKEEEGEEENRREEEQIDPEEQRTIRLLKVVKGESYKTKVDLPMYGGSLNDEELLDFIVVMDTYFDSVDVSDEQKVKVEKTKLKVNALLWWDYEQVQRRKKGKSRIASWDRMVAKLKGKFLPKDYEVQLYKRLKGLRKKDLDVKTYTDELYKLSIRSGRNEDEVEKVARYLGGLRFNI